MWHRYKKCGVVPRLRGDDEFRGDDGAAGGTGVGVSLGPRVRGDDELRGEGRGFTKLLGGLKIYDTV